MAVGSSEHNSDHYLCVAAVKANPYVLWPLVYHSTFSEAVEHLDELESALSGGSGVEQGGVLEALQYFHGNSCLVSALMSWWNCVWSVMSSCVHATCCESYVKGVTHNAFTCRGLVPMVRDRRSC